MTEIERLQMNANQANADFVAIKNKIVEKGVEVADGTKTAEYAPKVDEVYEKGKQAQYDEFWDIYQKYGNRTNYSYGFAGYGFDFDNFYPKYDIKVSGYCSNIFYSWLTDKSIGSLIQRLNECGVVLDTSKATNITAMFSYARFTEIPVIDCTGLSTSSVSINVFSHTYGYTKKIEKIIVKEDVVFTNWFLEANLVEVAFEGIIGQDINFRWSTRLSKASWVSIMTVASTTASITITGSLESVNKAFETSLGANDGSTSPEWLALKAARPTVSVSLV